MAWLDMIRSRRRQLAQCLARIWRCLESVSLKELELVADVVEVRTAMSTSRVRWLVGHETRLTSVMLTLAEGHVTVLDYGSTVLVENVLLAKFAKSGTSVEHHIGCLVQWSVRCFRTASITINVSML